MLSVSYTHDIRSQLDDMLTSLNLVIVVLIISAGMLAFVVLYNLNNISITERQRELATLKVLGFYDPEVAMYVYRENIVLTVAGGWPLALSWKDPSSVCDPDGGGGCRHVRPECEPA